MGIIEKIKEIEAEMARTQKNKATGFVSIIIFFLKFIGFFFLV
jgi:ribosome-interacting GTPase 1